MLSSVAYFLSIALYQLPFFSTNVSADNARAHIPDFISSDSHVVSQTGFNFSRKIDQKRLLNTCAKKADPNIKSRNTTEQPRKTYGAVVILKLCKKHRKKQ